MPVLRAVPAVVLGTLALFVALPALDAFAGKARDNDRDGLSNKTEKRLGTNWRRRDTDRDGLSDGAEVNKYKTNPLRKDTDRDRIGDGAEVLKYRTSPRRADTDRDGLSDFREIRRYHTNPRRADSDGDGLSDGAEVRRYKTNPRRADTDGDGLSDGAEVARGLNPLVKNSGSSPSGSPSPSPAPTTGSAPGRPNRACTTVVSSTGAAQSALAGAAPGAVICLANGSYGALGLSASKSGAVVVQPQNPGAASIAGATLGGSNITLSRFNVTSDINVQPGSDHVTVEFNRISGGYFGVNAGSTTSTSISDTSIVGNRFVGPFGEDALRVNRYHDGPDADPYGLLVEGNEITGVRENGNHSDCLQSVWGGDHLYFVRNYLHDNRCQGFFVKDQPAAVDGVVVSDNLMLRDAAPCDPAGSDCGQPAVFQVFGPLTSLTLSHNTIWTPEGESPVTLRSGPFGSIVSQANVLYREWSDSGSVGGLSDSGNVICKREGTWPGLGSGSRGSCSPSFVAPGSDDYRLSGGGAGIDWRPADQPYGP